MAKVLYVVPPGNDLGGIITSSENLMAGFREAGHKAEFALLRSGSAREGAPRGALADQYIFSENTGMWVHPTAGWRGKSYSTDRPREFLDYANTFDVVVFGAMYGLNNGHTQGSSAWAACITDIEPPVVFMVRDDHLEERTPWVMAFAPYVAGWAGVQECSFDSCSALGSPSALIYSGHGEAHPDALKVRRNAQALALATWKPWKQGRRLLMAAPHMNNLLVVGGDGIEFRYMRSPDKARPRDFYPDGRRIWDVAKAGHMRYLGPIREEERDALLLKSVAMVDLSYRENSGQINRVVIEAMRHGCIPVCDPRFISGDSGGNGRLFKAGVDYVAVDSRAEPKALAQSIDRAIGGYGYSVKKMREHNLSRVDEFSRKAAADSLVKLAKGKRAGVLYAKASFDEQKLAQGRKAFAGIFGGEL